MSPHAGDGWETLTFLGARREEPCEERTEDASSAMWAVVQAVLRAVRWRAEAVLVAPERRRIDVGFGGASRG